MKLASALLLFIISVVLCFANPDSAFSKQIDLAKRYAIEGDYQSARLTIIKLRRVANGRIPIDYRDLRAKARESSLDRLIAVLDRAKLQQQSGDSTKVLQSLDLAGIYATGLYAKLSPSDRFVQAERQIASRSEGPTASDLAEASRAAYQTRDYSATEEYANRALKLIADQTRPDGQLANWEHTLLGLCDFERGDQTNALKELELSIKVPGMVPLPSMALAKDLAKQQPYAVISFLDLALRRPEVHMKDRIKFWKTEVESGHFPDFAGLAVVGTGYSPLSEKP